MPLGTSAKLLVVSQTRKLDLEQVLCYELGPVPRSIASVDGGFVKTTKSKLLSLIKKDVAPVEQIPNDAAWIFDAMALLQSIISAPATFGSESFRHSHNIIPVRWYKGRFCCGPLAVTKYKKCRARLSSKKGNG